MKKLILATAVAASLVTSFARAEDAPPPPDNQVTYNAGVVSDYRYRGLTQTRFDPALQVGLDYTNNPTGFYLGTWASTIKWIKDAVGPTGRGPAEWDLYGGKRGDLGAGFTYDVGTLGYLYLNNDYDKIGANANTLELYGQVGYGPVYVKYSQAVTTLFGADGSKYSQYYDAGGNFDTFYGITLGVHLGRQVVRGPSSNTSYTDWKLGLSKTFDDLAGITLGVAYVGTNLKDGVETTPASDGSKNVGKGGVVVSLIKNF